MSLDLKKFIATHNFKEDKGLLYGSYRNRITAIRKTAASVITTITFNRSIDQIRMKEIGDKILEIKQSHRALLNFRVTNISLELVYYEEENINYEFYSILDLCIDILDRFYIATCEICPICNNALSTNDPFIKLNYGVIQTHERCSEQLLGLNAKIDNVNQNKKQISLSIILAFATLLLMIGIVTLLSLKGNFSFAILFAGWGFYLFYRLFIHSLKILYTKNQAIIGLIFAAICVIISTYIGSSIDMFLQLQSVYDDLVITQVFSRYLYLFVQNFSNYSSSILMDFFLSLLLMGFDVYRDIKLLQKKQSLIYKLK